ncbi:hypothetical protein TNCV_4253201 [Trichonephila clavipes]|nr:hypothetical protein TNCV_4253201 [Trichonephila clavipes]
MRNTELSYSAAEFRVTTGLESTQEPKPVDVQSVGCCLKSLSRAIAGRTDHLHLFSPSVCMRGKIHMAGIAAIAFSPTAAANV